ncbi:MAG: hypothetical protein IJB86_04120 [Clostridia bacterium]|nr:hypothetical protein [Clostridia bacterium]
MKKLAVLSVILVVIGVLCAVFFNSKKPENDVNPEEKPWTVGDNTEAPTAEATEQTVFDDAVMCFSNYINTTLRDKYTFVEESKMCLSDDLKTAVCGLYVYDVDGDETDELSVLYTSDGAFCLDVYEYVDGTAQLSATAMLSLDTLDEEMFTTDNTLSPNIAARMTIFPNGKDRFYCLTCELADPILGYNAYTVVYEYRDSEITLKDSFRLRTKNNQLTFTDTSDSTVLYSAVGTPVEPTTDTTDTTDVSEALTETATEVETELDVTVESEFETLSDAFNHVFADIGITSPDISVNGAALSKYKVTPVENEQKFFEFAGGNGEIMFSENGFLHSFILDV